MFQFVHADYRFTLFSFLVGYFFQHLLLVWLWRWFFLRFQFLADYQRFLVLFLFRLYLNSLNRFIFFVLLCDSIAGSPSFGHSSLFSTFRYFHLLYHFCLFQFCLHFVLFELLCQFMVFLHEFNILPSFLLHFFLEEMVHVLYLSPVVFHHGIDIFLVFCSQILELGVFFLSLHSQHVELIIVHFLVALYHTLILLSDSVQLLV